VAGEGAGQDLTGQEHGYDASGNPRLGDIGLFLKEKIQEHFANIGVEVNLKYIDPSYTIRSEPANAHDSVFCLLLGHNAVHAGMAGRTDMLVGYWRDEFINLPIAAAVSGRKRIEPDGRLWGSVVSSTGQPKVMR
jgi:6-phosphofructokinase 1